VTDNIHGEDVHPGDQTEPEGGSAPEPLLGRRPPSPEPLLGRPQSDEPIFAPRRQAAVAVEEARRTTEAPPRSVGEVLRSGDPLAISGLAERTARILFAVAVFLVPVVFDPRTVDSFNLVKLTTLWVLGVLATAAWWYSAYLAGRRIALPQSRLLRLALIVLAISVVATLFSPDRTVSVFGLYHRYAGVISIGLYVGVLVLMTLLYRRHPDGLRDVATAIAAAGGVVATYIVLQKLGFDVSQWRQASGTQPRFPIGTLGNSAFSAAYIGMAAPFVLYKAISTRLSARRVIWVGVLVVIIAGLWLTEGRSGILAAAGGIGALFLFMSRLRTAQKAGIVGLALVGLVVVSVVVGDPTDPAQRGVLRTGTVGYRVQIWDASVRMFLNRPVLGWGPESYFGSYPRFRRADEARRSGLAITDKPHDIYLEWATATGVVGLAAWALLVAGAVVLVAQRAPKLAPPRRLLGATFGAGLVAYLVQGVHSIDVPPLALMGWITLGAIIALFDVARGGDPADAEGLAKETDQAAEARPGRKRGPQWTRRPWVLPAGAGVIALLLVVLGFGPLRADHVAWAAERRAPAGWSGDTMELYERAIAINPREAAYRGLAASYLERIAGSPVAPFSREVALRRSVDLYSQALAIQPRNVYFMINIARVYARLGTEVDAKYFPQGDRYIGRAVTLDTLDPQMHDLYVDFLNKWQSELRGRERRDVLRRARFQAAIAKALRSGRVVR
jgi:O-antigen ligase